MSTGIAVEGVNPLNNSSRPSINPEFLTGVVEDDIKHRQSWRDLYTPEEEQQLQSLITESTESGVLFIFALSPGLDVTFSSAKEIDILKKKVDQVSKLGCRAFALLFDDIEPRLCPADREVFTSSARAQAVLANEIYNYLTCPDVFLFCPTEYSASLAVPNVAKSEYLSTVASCLAPGIAIVWTGPLVVSKSISVNQLQDLQKLLQHPIVIWDNLHANDYDQRRVFLGPYSGRPLALRRKGLIRGVLTNPNCEFEANYVALHTLAQWSRHGEQKCPQTTDKEMTELSAGVAETDQQPTADEAAENAVTDLLDIGDESTGGKPGLGSGYHPREALLVALRDWLALMLQDQQLAHNAPSKPSPAGASGATPTPMETDALEVMQSTEAEMQVESVNSNSDALKDGSGAELTGVSVDVTMEDLVLFADLFYLPFAHGPAGVRLLEVGHWLRENSYVCGPNHGDPEKNMEWVTKLAEFAEVVAAVARLRDRIQRLPSKSIAYELAPYVTEVYSVLGMVLDYFRWLETGVMATRSMCHLRRLLTWFSPGYRDMVTSGDQEPWTFRGGLITELQRILPLESAQDLFPAPSRAVVPGVTTILPNIIWPDVPQSISGGTSNGGTSATNGTLQQQPTAGGAPLDRFTGRSHTYIVRPYRAEDRVAVYAVFRRQLLARVGLSESMIPAELHDLPGDRYLSHFLDHSPENCLVVEGPPFLPTTVDPLDESMMRCIVGFGLSAPNAMLWARDRATRYIHTLRGKYPAEPSLVGSTTGQTGDVENGDCRTTTTTTLEANANAIGTQCTARRTRMSAEEFIKFLLEPIHKETNEVVDIANAGTVVPPPEPLGGGLLMEPALSGCLEPTPTEPIATVPTEPVTTETSVEMQSTNMAAPPPPPFPVAQAPAASSLPAPLFPDTTAPPSPCVNNSGEVVQQPLPPSSPASLSMGNIPSPCPLLAAGGPEALHTALTAHPATLWVELDDCGLLMLMNSANAGLPTPTMLMHHSLGLCADPPELVLDAVSRRLFICLLAGLKTVGAHGAHIQIDSINEHRSDLYRRFGFYPVPAASTEQTTVLARLI